MDFLVNTDLTTWQGMRTRNPRRLTLGSAQWGMPYGIANREGPPDDARLRKVAFSFRPCVYKKR